VLKEFKTFLMRGNIVELAIAVVIGTAFTALVNSFVASFVTPLIGILGKKNFADLTFTINDSVFTYGLFINALIQFVSVAAAVFFFIVKPLNAIAERRKRGEEPEPVELNLQEELLTEIRDLLRSQQQAQ
jgi:large conductance mechanosensitive channel